MASGFGSGTEDRQGPPSSSVKSSYASDNRRTPQCQSVEADMAIEENVKRACGSKKVWETGFLAMDDLRRQGKLCDIVIKVGDRSFPAHRVVLAAVCPYFRGMFAGQAYGKSNFKAKWDRGREKRPGKRYIIFFSGQVISNACLYG